MTGGSPPSGEKVPPLPFPWYRHGLFLTLVIVSGMVEVICYTYLGGIFCGYMTGNFVVLGLQIIRATASPIAQPLVALGGFMLGSFAAGITLEFGAWRKWHMFRRIQSLLVVDILLLTSSSIVAGILGVEGISGNLAALALMAPAMAFQMTAGSCLGVPYLAMPLATSTTNTLFSDNPFKRSNLDKTLRKSSMLISLLVGSLIGSGIAIPTQDPFITLAVAPTVLVLCLASLEVALHLHRRNTTKSTPQPVPV